jgi:hypothetical protein
MELPIPVTFELDGMEYKGFFSRPHGSGGNVWFLTIDNKFQGQLMYSEQFGWRYSDQRRKKEMVHLSEYFGQVVTAWYE